jgi:hypothetical protein
VRETLAGLEVLATFDAEGNELGLTYPGGRAPQGRSFRYTLPYDELHRIATIADASSTGTLAAYSYTGPSRVSRRDYGNGTRSSGRSESRQAERHQQPLGRPRRPAHEALDAQRHRGGAVIDDRSFTWDPNGSKSPVDCCSPLSR